jgi:hypothetical protein
MADEGEQDIPTGEVPDFDAEDAAIADAAWDALPADPDEDDDRG